MTALDPALCARLVSEAREAEKEWDADAANEGKNFLPAHYVEGWNDALEAFALHLADQLEAALAEVARMRPVVDAAVRVAELDEIFEAHPSIDDEVGDQAERDLPAAVLARKDAIDAYRKATL